MKVTRKRKMSKADRKYLFSIVDELNQSINKNSSMLQEVNDSIPILDSPNNPNFSDDSEILPEPQLNSRKSSKNRVLIKKDVNHNPSDAYKVKVRIDFLKIGEIDTLKEHFQAEVLIQAKWIDPELKLKDLEHFDPKNYWNPNLEIDNSVGDINTEVSYRVIMENNDPHLHIYETTKMKGTFLENLELYDFPVDVQDITITLTTNKACHEIHFLEDVRVPSGINTLAFIDQQEWHLYDHVEVKNLYLHKDVLGTTSPAISFTCHARRRPGYFYWNIHFLCFFITIMIFATFAVKPNLPQNRLQLGFTLLLTAVTFKFVVNRCLPTISYLTSLDKYVLGSMFLQCIICSWHAIISTVDEPELYTTFNGYFHSTLAEYQLYLLKKNDSAYELEQYSDSSTNKTMVKTSVLTRAERYDRYALYFFSSSFIIFHIIYIIWTYVSVYRNRKEMKKNDELHEEKLTHSRNVIIKEYATNDGNAFLLGDNDSSDSRRDSLNSNPAIQLITLCQHS